MGARRKARECALQMLFQNDVAHQTLEELLRTYWGEMSEAKEDVREFADRLVIGTIAHMAEVDGLVGSRAEHWRIERMAIVDRNLLRLAVFEFLYEPQTPKTVVINEALEIARRFSTFEATQFINGVLDSIKRDLENRASATTA